MGVSYSILLRYCNNAEFGLVDFDFLARACYVLNCDIAELIEYKTKIYSKTQMRKTIILI